MQNKGSKILKYVISGTLAVFLLFFAFSGVDWAAFSDGLKGANWWWVTVSMACGICAFWFRGVRWKGILSPLDPSVRAGECFASVNLANLSNLVIPYSGELVRCGIISDRHSNPGTRYDKVLGTVVLERAWDMLSIILIIILLLVLQWQRFGAFFTQNIWNPLSARLGGATGIVAGAIILTGVAFMAAVIGLRKRPGIFSKIYNAIEGLLNGFSSCLRMDRKWLFLLYTAIIWAMYWLQIVFIFKALGLGDLGLADALFIMAVGSIASFVPVPGGFGAYHYLVALAMSALYGFPWESGILIATLAHESQALTMIVSGTVSGAFLQARKK